jgi:predicted ester cyclase
MAREESTAELTALAGQEEAARSEQPARPAQTDAAFPDLRFQMLDLVADDRHAAVRWRARGTFAGPGRFNGMALERAAAA